MSSTSINEQSKLAIGIDLGTTNSVIATVNERPNGNIVSKVIAVPRPDDMYNSSSGEVRLSTARHPTLSSCVYYRMENNYEPLVGEFAKKQYPKRPHLVAKSIKSQMGNRFAEGLSPDVPDKTPSEISSRILKALIKEASKIYHTRITEAVITVPANFDPAMCKATLDAAELAGIKVRNPDGSERPVLLSEPNAVIYDLVNQIRNGEFSDMILDLSEKKRVLVFDLGGGTLDITLHEIVRKNDDILKIDDIATNRYTLLGGDDFDEQIAKEMYKRYLNKYSRYPDVVSKLRQEENVIMPVLRGYAEDLKVLVNEKSGNDDDYSMSGWDDDFDEETVFPVGGSIGGTGYSYDDEFTKQEIENILSVFMAENLEYDDYKRIDEISDTRNIIYPILDVLKKASDMLETPDVKVDAVIVNGGMSKFYMVTQRLERFFGFEPIVALDPDLAVARGAAVCHYYLNKYDELQDDMKMIGDAALSDDDNTADREELARPELSYERKPQAISPIEWGRKILNDSLYLGVRNGGVQEIIPTGAELPYNSPVMTGFRIEPGQRRIAVPIKSRNSNGTYRNIANGNIFFRQNYKDGAFVSFIIHMGSSKVITMKAWTSEDEGGFSKIEEGTVEISIDNTETSANGARITAPKGAELNPAAEIDSLLKLVRNYENFRTQPERGNISKRIAACVSNIYSARNKEDFAEIVLEKLSRISSQEARQRLFTIARKIGVTWSEAEKRKLAKECMNQLAGCLNGLSSKGPQVSANIEAIYTMSICANEMQLSRLDVLHNSSKYRQACIYTHAKTKTAFKWLQDEFKEDLRKLPEGQSRNLQFSAHAMGVALRKDNTYRSIVPAKTEMKIVGKLCKAIESGNLTKEELISCLIALGCICDQRTSSSPIDDDTIEKALQTIDSVYSYYPETIISRQSKTGTVVSKMINGNVLNFDEEQFLLTKLEI